MVSRISTVTARYGRSDLLLIAVGFAQSVRSIDVDRSGHGGVRRPPFAGSLRPSEESE